MIEGDGVGRRRRDAASFTADGEERRRCQQFFTSRAITDPLPLHTSLFPPISVIFFNS